MYFTNVSEHSKSLEREADKILSRGRFEKFKAMKLQNSSAQGSRIRARNEKHRIEEMNRQEELKKLFIPETYQEKKIGDAFYVQMYDWESGLWKIAVYTLGNFRRYKGMLRV